MVTISAEQLRKIGLPAATTNDGSLTVSDQGAREVGFGFFPACHLPVGVAASATTIRHHVHTVRDPHALEVFVDVWGEQRRAEFIRSRQLRASLRGRVEAAAYVERRARIRAEQRSVLI